LHIPNNEIWNSIENVYVGIDDLVKLRGGYRKEKVNP